MSGNVQTMGDSRAKKTAASLNLMILLFAMVAGLVIAFDGFRLAVDSSVVGGTAVVVVAALLLGVVGLRAQTKWRELRARR